MGMFSWTCSCCKESIPNMHSSKSDMSACVLVTPEEVLTDAGYDGYGNVAGEDIYALLGNGDRDLGIHRYCHVPDELPFQVKMLHSNCYVGQKYEDLKASESCPVQGFFYD